ncbi:MAG: universal stress protein [Bacteroidota bacterium]
MNTILVPVDFSEISDNALTYAVHLANYLSANLVLLHVNSIPVYNNENDVLIYTMHDSKVNNQNLLKEKAESLKVTKQFLGSVDYFVEIGDLESIIIDYTIDKNIDLIVMGITAQSKIGQVFLGSNAVSVSKESSVPVFIIPSNCTYKKVSNIAYASEYDVHITEQTGLIQIKYIASLFGASLSVLHVISDNHLLNEVESETDLFVEHKLENIDHKTFILSETNAATALLDFIKMHDVDVIVLEQKKHSFLHNLLYNSTTKDVAFNSPVPVLTIHS